MHRSQIQLNMNGIADQGSSIEQADQYAQDLSNPISLAQKDTSHNHVPPVIEDGSVASQQSSFNQQLSAQLGGGLSEMSVGEVYESYHFMQNSLISFYPKDVRRCF